ncbi:hypothetical protein [Thermomonas sp.]|uniref:hypothetical protein n=1 Tax=Thermomonas sp. TaxID=1971895 RepID=UPI002C40E7DB|nr:hypothetical protein [Thermomonas sp.]HRO62885.1 hypothetical protein [Thermomonas sp.]
MTKTTVSLVTPHILSVIDLAKQAETGINVDWHLKDAVAKTYADLGHQFNARDLISAFIHGLETTAEQAEPRRKFYSGALRTAAALATQRLNELD